MSKIAIKSSSSGTATFTIESPSTNTDRTFNLPDSAGTVATAESTLAQFNVTGSAPVFACRAWVNFNGTGTVAIRASGNVSSITDNGTGDYTVNFTTAMPDANYSWQINTGTQGATFIALRGAFNNATAPSTNSLRVNIKTTSIDDNSDMAAVTVAIFR